MRQQRHQALPAYLLFVFVLLGASSAMAQKVELSVQSREIYADVPFVLQVSASGFEESPEPEVAPFEIPGATVQFLGMSPSVVSRRSISNGRVSQSRDVRFLYSYRIEVSSAGRYSIPAISVEQGGAGAQSRPSGFEVKKVEESSNMRIAMAVPQRAVWLGESFEVSIDLLLRASPRDLSFVIPIFDHPAFAAEAPEIPGAEHLGFQAGANELQLPYSTDEIMDGGIKYTRFQFKAVVTPTKAGRFELDAPRVVARLKMGTGRDAFGFRQAKYSQFKSTGKAMTFEVKGLPTTGKPASFSNAVGPSFSIAVSSSRSVVSVGEPIELSIVLSGQRGLEGLSLPPLIGEGRLDKALFDVLDNSGTGKMSEDGRNKIFKVSVVLKSTEAREIPPIEFAYFDPELGEYRVATSEPIALNVNGAAMVGAQDVVANRRERKRDAKGVVNPASFSGDLTPSSGTQTLREVTTLAALTPILAGLYILPLLFFVVLLWMQRTGESRGHSSELRDAWKALEKNAQVAKREAAAQSAAGLIKTIRELGRITGNRPSSTEWMAQLESLAYDPSRQDKPISAELVDSILAELRDWKKSQPKKNKTASSAALVFFIGLNLWSSAARAQSADLADAREQYIDALEVQDRSERTQRFSESENLYAQLVKEYPGRPELLVDWGNAALGANHLGVASLAYKRALTLDKGLVRASKNLGWIRSQLSSEFVPTPESSAVDSLFFWHSSWSLATRHLVAAIAFAFFVVLLFPIGTFQYIRRRVAAAPALIFVGMLSSALLEPSHAGAAVVVVDGQTLRSADSLGAPTSFSKPIPEGAEVTLLESREDWSHVTLANGKTGWLAGNAVRLVDGD